MFSVDYDEIVSIRYAIHKEMNRIVEVQKSLAEKRDSIADDEIINRISNQISDLGNALDDLYKCSSNIMKALYKK